MTAVDASSFKSDSTQHSTSPTVTSTTESSDKKTSKIYQGIKWGGTALWGSAFTASIILFVISSKNDMKILLAAGTALIVFAFCLLFLWGGILSYMRHKNEPCC